MRHSPESDPWQCQLTCLLSHLSPQPHLHSLRCNGLCYNELNYYEYTVEGITALCEGLKGSAVTSLKCAAAQ